MSELYTEIIMECDFGEEVVGLVEQFGFHRIPGLDFAFRSPDEIEHETVMELWRSMRNISPDIEYYVGIFEGEAVECWSFPDPHGLEDECDDEDDDQEEEDLDGDEEVR